jgi:hypothetical protein
MEYIREPKGVDFVVESHIVTDEDRRIMSKIIAEYKATGKITRVSWPQRNTRHATKRAKK